MAAVTLIPWFRDFFVDFLKDEESEELKLMGARFHSAFVDNTWDSGASYFLLDFYDSEIELLTNTGGFQRMYDRMKVVRREGRNVPGRRWEYNFITYRMQEFVRLVHKLTDGHVRINTKRAKKVAIPETIIVQDIVERPEGCVQGNYDRHLEAAQRMLDELQACLVLKGARKISIKELAAMPLGKLLFMCLPNDVNLKAELMSLPRNSPQLT